MKEEILLQLQASYAFLVGMVILLAILPIHAQMRALLLSITYLFVLVTHIIAGRTMRGEETNKMFFLLTVLWIIKLSIFLLNEGLNFFFQRAALILDWLDLMFLFAIAFLISLSFIGKKPFWYMKAKRRITMVFGIVAFLFLGWVSLQFIKSFMDFL
jgi:hypothetical protein